MPILYLLITLVAVAVAIFALQNAEPVTVRFLAWQVERTPLAAVILVSGAVGAILVSLIGFAQRWKLSQKMRQLEVRMRTLEAARPTDTTEKAR